MRLRAGAALSLAMLLAACSGGIIPQGAQTGTGAPPRRPGGEAARPVPATPRPTLPPPAGPAVPAMSETAVAMGLAQGPSIASLAPPADRSRLALQAFRQSCPSLLSRTDQSGLTSGSDWQQACSAAASWPDATATDFFDRYFETVQVGEGKGFITGYFEPEIMGARAHRPGYDVPIYRRPPDIIDVDLGLFSDALKGRKIRGKVQGGNFVPYDERARIEAGSLAGRGLELAWAADPIEFFFLQVQGSGRLRLPDGSVMRIGYDGQNGRDYTGIGKLMKDRGLLGDGQTNMQGIMNWLRANPEQGRAIMDENKSFVFFKELTGPGPLGALGLALTPEASVAADPRYVPLGAPVLLSMDRAEPNGIWIAQDTGGAIKGANRFDSFWGAGEKARAIAGGMAAHGSVLLLVPIGTYARLAQANGWASARP